MNIRTATTSDWPALEHINHVIDYGQPEAFMHEQVKLERVLVAEKDGTVVGYALWQFMWGNNPFFALLKVLPEFQKNGIGTQLLTAGEAAIKKAGFNSYLSSTELSNEPGQTWHDKNNFTPIGRLGMLHGEELFYKKDLQ